MTERASDVQPGGRRLQRVPSSDAHGRRSDPVDVAVVIVTWNSAGVILDCLASIPEAVAGMTHSVVVVDNASSDETVQLVDGHHDAPLLVRLEENAGYAAGVNAGIAAARARCHLVANPDVRFGVGAIEGLAEALESPGRGIAVPRILDSDGRLVHSLRREPTVLRALCEAILGGRRAREITSLSETIADDMRYELPQQPDWASGAVMLISAECLRATGAWDESFFLYSEETDFALRARDAGFVVRYEPSATVVHAGGDLHRSPRLWTMQAVNRVRLYRSRHGRAATAAFWLAVCLNEALRAFGSTRRTSRPALRELLRRGLPLIVGRAEQPVDL